MIITPTEQNAQTLRLRQRFSYLTKTDDAPQKGLIKHIVGVGAIEGYGGDYELIESGLRHLSRNGIFLSSNFNYEAINFEEDDKDFLDPNLKLKTDLIVTCNIHSPPQALSEFFKLSPHHYNKGGWEDAALRTDAKVIVIQGFDFPTSFFLKKGNFVSLNNTNPYAPPILIRRNTLPDFPHLRLMKGFQSRESVEVIPQLR